VFEVSLIKPLKGNSNGIIGTNKDTKLALPFSGGTKYIHRGNKSNKPT
jgi:hypothetical protein